MEVFDDLKFKVVCLKCGVGHIFQLLGVLRDRKSTFISFYPEIPLLIPTHAAQHITPLLVTQPSCLNPLTYTRVHLILSLHYT